jgi:transcriptional regulator with XRE-family HTH domain
MPTHLVTHRDYGLAEILRHERHIFAAKIRIVRASLGWSQSELGKRVGLSQRAIHKLEQGDTEPRRATFRAIEDTWKEQGLDFDDLPDGGFRVIVHGAALHRASPTHRHHRPDLGITSIRRNM